MDDLLRDRLAALNADLHWNGFDQADAVWLACDLLVAGVDTPAVAELAGEPFEGTPGLREIVLRMFAELGIAPITEQESYEAIHRVATRMATGDLEAALGTRLLLRLWSAEDTVLGQAMYALREAPPADQVPVIAWQIVQLVEEELW